MKTAGASTDTPLSELMQVCSKPLRILYVGCMGNSSRGLMAARALSELGHQLHTVQSEVLDQDGERTYFSDMAFRALARLGFPPDRQGVNRDVTKVIESERFDVMWVSKSLSIRPSLLQAAREKNPGIVLIFHSEDDMYARHNQSIWFRRSLPLYDVVFTHKSYNANPDELPALGARKVVMVDKCFDRLQHKPVEVTEDDRERLGGAVGFVGTFELDRAEQMLRLAEAGIAVRIWGARWEQWIGKHPLLRVEGRVLTTPEYVKAIASTDINLGFLRRQNRDLQTDRSVEIPACGAFMLAERSDEHLRLFSEGEEAEFFVSFDELRTKLEYYLANPDRRRTIAQQARARCLKDGYSFHDRFETMLEIAMESAS